ncbi:hypothetical protein D3C75_956570 [compost metagenome]
MLQCLRVEMPHGHSGIGRSIDDSFQLSLLKKLLKLHGDDIRHYGLQFEMQLPSLLGVEQLRKAAARIVEQQIDLLLLQPDLIQGAS